jgi:predicted outer membrane repeat protein
MNVLNRLFLGGDHEARQVPRRPRGARWRRANRRRLQPGLLALEGRQLLATFTVTSLGDGTGAGTLRYEIGEANSTEGPNTIVFDSTVFGSAQTITLTQGELVLSNASGITITGPAAGLTISAGGASRVIKVASGAAASFSGLTITGGAASGTSIPADGGGGLYNEGMATLLDCTISGNSAKFSGGGIYSAYGSTTLTECTVDDNSAVNIGGGIYNHDAALTMTDCTISGNYANAWGGGVNNNLHGTVWMTNCTLSANHSNAWGGGMTPTVYYGNLILNACTVSGNSTSSASSAGGIGTDFLGATNLVDTIVAGNTGPSGPSDLVGDVDPGSAYNPIGSGGSGGLSNGNQSNIVLSTGATLGLAPLGNYGGPTLTMALRPGSPAIAAGVDAVYPRSTKHLVTDQRGFPLDSTSATHPDIGAFQLQSGAPVVTSTGDGALVLPGTMGLRGAIDLANLQTSAAAITFDSNVFGTAQTITLNQGQLELSNTSGITITGSAAGVTISGGGNSRVFQVDKGVTASLSGLTITGGVASNFGGGLYNLGSVTFTDCTLSGNSAPQGGGLFDVGTMNLTNCTLYDNSATFGGGIFNAGPATLIACTISGNSGTNVGGFNNYTGPNYTGTATLDDTIVASNTGPNGVASDIGGDNADAVTGSSDLIGTGGSGGLTNGVDGIQTGVSNPLLGALGDYGGATETIPLLPSSPAINAGNNSLLPQGLNLDQRGELRIVGKLDIGAFESQGFVVNVDSGSGQEAPVGTAFSSPLIVTVRAENAVEPVAGGTMTFSAPSNQNDASVTFSPAATVTIGSNGEASVTAMANATGGRYQVSATTTWTTSNTSFNLINQVAPKITWKDPAAITYGTALTLADQLDASTSVSGTFNYTPAAGTVLSAGNNQTLSVTFTPNDTTDYLTTTASVRIDVTAAPLTVTANDVSMVYGAALPTLTVSYSGFENGDTASSLSTQPTVSTTATDGSVVGSYTISAIGAVDSDYTFSYVMGSLSVTPAALVITANIQTKIYGAALPSLTVSYTGFVNGDSSSSLTTQPVVSTAATAESAVGSYRLNPIGAVDANYTISYVPGDLSVTPAALTITANDQTKVYGAALPSLTVSYSGFENGDTSSDLTTQPTVSTTATAKSAVDSYTIGASGAADSDYTISYVSGNLSVTPAALVITANDQTKVYGAALPALTVSYSGLVNGDSSSSLTTQPTISTPATARGAVGSYTISASAAVDPNYTISYAAGTLNVTPAALVITANNQTKVYGAALPTLTVSYSGLVNGDAASSLTTQPTVSTTATAQSVVGRYRISASGAVDPNYTITYTAGTLTVTPAALLITANNATMVAGHAVPALSLSYSGFVNGDSPASLTTPPILATTESPDIPAGSYAITVSGASSPDYTITTVPGTLLVSPAYVTVESVAIEKVQTGRHKTMEAIVMQFSGELDAADAASLGNYTLVTVANRKKHPSKPVRLSLANYNAANNTVTLTTAKKLVLKPSLELTLNAAGLMDTMGRALDGRDDGQPGGNFTAILSKGGATVTSAVRLDAVKAPSATAVDALLAGGLDLEVRHRRS